MIDDANKRAELKQKALDALAEYLVAGGAMEADQQIGDCMIALSLVGALQDNEQYRCTVLAGSLSAASGLAGYAGTVFGTYMLGGEV
ncbi:hypothetical protein TIN4_67 [Tsukamurella phage TIN4]|uniref:Uncharacterized protein n=2 Tax=Tinduovirus TIN3 TaxID=1982571 RepID=A0A0K0N644_9CAUD|nr:hypothetical protein AVT54_gp058 [Tsukamurella phage TIN3]YP_009604197.1 hypothetical protein FDH87_gp058 [Tsukamurella phage TIN4]AKJ71864.1 hypothetical protein TIN3_67 [Tsukamurella phage TIN3]AKJ71973.1 hypothetical protein TIN4_67 [Tsukamurella phage TIN4]